MHVLEVSGKDAAETQHLVVLKSTLERLQGTWRMLSNVHQQKTG
jgi:hypothetical protein